MTTKHEGDACPAYANQDPDLKPEVPTLAQLLEARQLLAFRAMGTLISLSNNGQIPEIHITHVDKLITEYDRLTAAINARMS